MNALELTQVCKRFGGHDVLADVSLSVRAGQRVAVIGPNGAGKSTLFNVISGELPVTSGSIRLAGEEVSRRSPQRRVHQGLARSFQLTSLLRGLTVYENVLAALHGRQGSRYDVQRSYRSVRAYPVLLPRAESLLRDMDLWDWRSHGVATLSFGQQKKLEVAMTLALNPSVLLLDEPAAGLDVAEVPGFIAVIRRVVQGATLLFTEHDMAVVFDLAERVVVLSRGRVIADGTPEAIRQNDSVRELYLGAGLAEKVRGHA